ncbi:MAG: pseudouridine synthase [Bacilli bacterium]
MERLQKVIASRGYTSRRKAEELIKQGKVKVNGTLIKELGTKVDNNALIEIDGVTLGKEDKKYYLFYKPEGIISSTKDPKGRKTVLDYFKTNERIYPIGRLDYDTSGIILLTNDGEFANSMMHPRNEIDKVYTAKIKGIIDGYSIKRLKAGIVLDGYKTSNARVKLKETNRKNKTSIVEIIIHEGRYHQVKRMFEEIDYPVILLKRERIAFLDLKGLKKGEYRPLTIKEVKKLYSIIKK